MEKPKVGSHCLINFVVQQGSFTFSHLSKCNQLSILQEHYLYFSIEQTQINRGSSSVTPLRYPLGVHSFLDLTKEQLLLDLPECFWICSLGIVIMAFNCFVQVQVPMYLGLPCSTMWLADGCLGDVDSMNGSSLFSLGG